GVGVAEPQPGSLDGVVGLAEGAEHPVGHRPQVGPVGLEPLRQPVTLLHRYLPPSRSDIAVSKQPPPRHPAECEERPLTPAISVGFGLGDQESVWTSTATARA